MNRKFFVLTCVFLTLLVILFSCKKKTTTENNPPNKPSAPLFTSVENLIGDNVIFKVSASDPDGDSISARFDWGDGDTSSWSNFVASGDTVKRKHTYDSIKTYYVRAQIKDSKEMFSDWSESAPIEIKDTLIDTLYDIVWTCVTPTAPWSPRALLTSVVFDNKIWILGGMHDYDGFNDVWFSSDGLNWSCATESAPWIPRGGHTSVVFDNKIWIIGGWGSDRPFNDVWYSSDGVNWICATESTPWTSRAGHASVVLDNKIWVLGGEYRGHYIVFNDVWYSADGDSWICANESTEWLPRSYHKSVVFKEKMWVCGGDDQSAFHYRDVWNSTNGGKWTCVTDFVEWSGRIGHEFIVFDNKMWILGGFVGETWDGGASNDVWCSKTGSVWTCLTDSSPWHRREYFSSVVFDNKIWIMGGYSELNDVWYGEIVHGKR